VPPHEVERGQQRRGTAAAGSAPAGEDGDSPGDGVDRVQELGGGRRRGARPPVAPGPIAGEGQVDEAKPRPREGRRAAVRVVLARFQLAGVRAGGGQPGQAHNGLDAQAKQARQEQACAGPGDGFGGGGGGSARGRQGWAAGGSWPGELVHRRRSSPDDH
jgi:hypothetical protein